MAATVQMNTRINPALKTGGDAVLKRNGYTPSSAIQALWAYMVENNALPSFMAKKKGDTVQAQIVREIEENAGLAIKMQEQLMGIPVTFTSKADEVSYDELKELAWEDRGVFDD